MKFTPRQWQVIWLSNEGLPTKIIARNLGLSPETVKTHIKNVVRLTKVPRKSWWKLKEDGEVLVPDEFVSIGYLGSSTIGNLTRRGAVTTTLTKHIAFEDDVEIYIRVVRSNLLIDQKGLEMVDLNAWKKMAEFHARRGENVNINPAKFMEVLSAFQTALNGLRAVEALPHNPEASSLATECLTQVGCS